jgi:hypothetical protein
MCARHIEDDRGLANITLKGLVGPTLVLPFHRQGQGCRTADVAMLPRRSVETPAGKRNSTGDQLDFRARK